MFRKTLLLLTLAVCALAAAPALSQQQRQPQPQQPQRQQPAQSLPSIEGEQLYGILIDQDRWDIGYKNAATGMNLVEYVLKGETATNWSRMITVQIFYNNPTPLPAFAKSLKTAFDKKQECERGQFHQIASGKKNGYPAMRFAISCPLEKRAKRGEWTLYQAIRGKDSLYVIQRAWRGEPYKTDAPISGLELSTWAQFMERISVCDTRQPKDHPCPQS
jgi:hypothetical protein